MKDAVLSFFIFYCCVIKYADQSKLEKKAFIVAYSFTEQGRVAEEYRLPVVTQLGWDFLNSTFYAGILFGLISYMSYAYSDSYG